jgi:hypothetical protein
VKGREPERDAGLNLQPVFALEGIRNFGRQLCAVGRSGPALGANIDSP